MILMTIHFKSGRFQAVAYIWRLPAVSHPRRPVLYRLVLARDVLLNHTDCKGCEKWRLTCKMQEENLIVCAQGECGVA
jgi:hypothetical protein